MTIQAEVKQFYIGLSPGIIRAKSSTEWDPEQLK